MTTRDAEWETRMATVRRLLQERGWRTRGRWDELDTEKQCAAFRRIALKRQQMEGPPSGLTWRHVLFEPAREQEPQEFLMDRVAEGGGGPQNSSVLTADQQLISPLEQ